MACELAFGRSRFTAVAPSTSPDVDMELDTPACSAQALLYLAAAAESARVVQRHLHSDSDVDCAEFVVLKDAPLDADGDVDMSQSPDEQAIVVASITSGLPVVLPDPAFVPHHTASMFDCGPAASSWSVRELPPAAGGNSASIFDCGAPASASGVQPDPSYTPLRSASAFDCGAIAASATSCEVPFTRSSGASPFDCGSPSSPAVVPDYSYVPACSASAFDCGFAFAAAAEARSTTSSAPRGASPFDCGAPAKVATSSCEVLPDPDYVPAGSASAFDCGFAFAAAAGVAEVRSTSTTPRGASPFDCGAPAAIATSSTEVVPDPDYVPAGSASAFDCGFAFAAPAEVPACVSPASAEARGASPYDCGAPPRQLPTVTPDPDYVPYTTASIYDSGAPSDAASLIPAPAAELQYPLPHGASIFDVGLGPEELLDAGSPVPGGASVYDVGAPDTLPQPESSSHPPPSFGASIYDF